MKTKIESDIKLEEFVSNFRSAWKYGYDIGLERRPDGIWVKYKYRR